MKWIETDIKSWTAVIEDWDVQITSLYDGFTINGEQRAPGIGWFTAFRSTLDEAKQTAFSMIVDAE